MFLINQQQQLLDNPYQHFRVVFSNKLFRLYKLSEPLEPNNPHTSYCGELIFTLSKKKTVSYILIQVTAKIKKNHNLIFVKRFTICIILKLELMKLVKHWSQM